MIILGAGLAGTLAGALNQEAEIFEAGDNKTSHQAVLRFRTPDISLATGIPFKKVTVYKNIWDNDRNVELCNKHIVMYARKVAGSISCRSITELETVERWIAPPDFHDQLKAQCKGRIKYNCKIDRDFIKDCQQTMKPIVSTIPLQVLCDLLDLPITSHYTQSQEIYVTKLLFPECDVYMTNYYPGYNINCYRASITGDVLIMESMQEISDVTENIVQESFGLGGLSYERIITNHKQENGKMRAMDENERRQIILDLTLDNGIFSLGRFATWRNILLDDIYKDIQVIKRLANKDQYEIHRSI